MSPTTAPIFSHSRHSWVITIVALCLAYTAFSWLGYFLVIPPGIVSVMWPSAGIALGFVYVFGTRIAIGVFLGSFLTHALRYGVPDSESLWTVISIAAGATLHATFGAILIRKFSNNPLHSGNLREILIFVFWGGIVACLISAMIGTFSIDRIANFSPSDFWLQFGTWWLGDTLGVVMFAPLAVLFLTKTHDNSLASINFKALVIIPVVICIVVFSLLFDAAKKELESHTYDEYQRETANLANEFSQTIAVNITTVKATTAFLAAASDMTADSFKIFTTPLLKNSNGLYGLSWLPKIEKGDRNVFTQAIRDEGYPDFDIQARNDKGQLQSAKQREVYYPLAYTEPYARNKSAHGFDVYGQDGISRDVRRGILDLAKAMNKPRATSRFSIVQKQDEYGFIIYSPVYKTTDTNTPEHVGYINGIFVYPDLVGSLTEKLASVGTNFYLIEERGNQDPLVLYDSRTSDKKEGPDDSYDLEGVKHTSHDLNVAGQTWKMIFTKNCQLITGDYLRSLWYFAIGGSVFTLLLFIILTMISARNDSVEKLVALRTEELNRANEELEEFAYRTSHDLRSPIVSSVQLLNLADDAIKDNETDFATKSIAHARQSLSKLESLISDILTLTEIGSQNETEAVLDIAQAVDEALAKLDHADGFARLTVIKEISLEERVIIKPSRFKLILENLISNAAKYQDPKKDEPYLKINCFRVGEKLHLHVSDNGLGIDPQYRKQMFEMFKRFHPKVAIGSGLGLYLMRKSAHILGGDIEYVPLENGSLFKLIVPVRITDKGDAS
ncbi:MAG: CHASE domain-containing protein [Rhizobiaceae bacterium]|nr:CHASE domain-containing protein [Rhizobiaceae bacterium]